jgi:hypothetical protein
MLGLFLAAHSIAAQGAPPQAGTKAKANGDGTRIRVRNSSGVDFENVVVGSKHYGDIKAGATTDYQTWEVAYRYAFVSLIAGSEPKGIQPIDFVREQRLGHGYFTYVLSSEEGRLDIRAERESKGQSVK